jgi:hypothetical protein
MNNEIREFRRRLSEQSVECDPKIAAQMLLGITQILCHSFGKSEVGMECYPEHDNTFRLVELIEDRFDGSRLAVKPTRYVCLAALLADREKVIRDRLNKHLHNTAKDMIRVMHDFPGTEDQWILNGFLDPEKFSSESIGVFKLKLLFESPKFRILLSDVLVNMLYSGSDNLGIYSKAVINSDCYKLFNPDPIYVPNVPVAPLKVAVDWAYEKLNLDPKDLASYITSFIAADIRKYSPEFYSDNHYLFSSLQEEQDRLIIRDYLQRCILGEAIASQISDDINPSL